MVNMHLFAEFATTCWGIGWIRQKRVCMLSHLSGEKCLWENIN